MTDQEIIECIQQGNIRPAYRVMLPFKQMVINLVMHNSGNKEDAQDVFHDAFILFMKKVKNPEFVLSSKISTYFYGIALRIWWRQIEKRRKVVFKENVPDVIGTVDEHFKDEGLDILKSCMKQIPIYQSRILEKYYLEQKSMEEVAEDLGYKSSDTAKNLKNRAIRNLEKIVSSEWKKEDFISN